MREPRHVKQHPMEEERPLQQAALGHFLSGAPDHAMDGLWNTAIKHDVPNQAEAVIAWPLAV